MDAGRYDQADARYDLALAAARQAGDKELEGTTSSIRASSPTIATNSTAPPACTSRRSSGFRRRAIQAA
jgi:hypothetical protein